ncbi:uncharacterized protein LOC142775633 [Rhipicephalus microplus]|uniref:uncharacterized protein LOC142775633 n=1 Tax=Rhipicephalus microplus TaxID=6941 RepID=UPI003F6CFBD5
MMPSMHSYTVAKKMEVVQWHRQGGRNAHTTLRHFNIDRRRIPERDSKYVALLQQNFGKSNSRRKLRNGAPLLRKEVDDAVFEVFESERSAGHTVSNRLLAEEAVRVARSLQLENSVALDHYIARWKKRFGIFMRQAENESQMMPNDYAEAARAFRLSVNELRLMHNYAPFNMANMDQKMVRMDCPTSQTNNIIGENSVHIANTGCVRQGFTVALAPCASGHKLSAFVILKKPSGRISTKVNVHVTASKNG